MDERPGDGVTQRAEDAMFERHGYLEVHVRPETQGGGKQAAIERAAVDCARLGAQRLLVVSEDRDPPKDRTEAYWAGEATAIRLCDVRTAVFVSARPVTALDEFAAEVARSRGADLRFFTDREDALRWLMQPFSG